MGVWATGVSVDAGTLRYFAQAARFKGVPVDDLDDAVQDMWIRLRKYDEGRRGWKSLVAYAAIDAAQRYGWTSRGGRDRTTEPLEFAYSIREPGDDYAAVDARIDMALFLLRLTSRQRDVLLCRGRNWVHHRGKVRIRARKRWEKEMAA